MCASFPPAHTHTTGASYKALFCTYNVNKSANTMGLATYNFFMVAISKLHLSAIISVQMRVELLFCVCVSFPLGHPLLVLAMTTGIM